MGQKMRWLLLTILLITGTAFSQPIPLVQSNGKLHQSGLRGTENLPLIVKILPSPKDDSQATNEKREDDHLIAVATISLAIVTFFLALFTGMLWYATYKLAKDTKKATADQADKMEISLTIAKNQADQALNASFLQIFPIIEKHHSPEITEYRRFAMDELGSICNAARKAGENLKVFNPTAYKKASELANYYESISMLIEHGKKNLLPDVVNILIDMIHVSAHDIWERFYDNIDVIHPQRLGSWAGSFEELYFEIGIRKVGYPANRARLER